MELKPTNEIFSPYDDIGIIEVAENLIKDKQHYPASLHTRKNVLNEITARFNNLLFNLEKERILSNFEKTFSDNQDSDNVDEIRKMSDEDLLKNSINCLRELTVKQGKSNKLLAQLAYRFSELLKEKTGKDSRLIKTKISELGPRDAIHVATEAECYRISILLHMAGKKWTAGDSYLESNKWNKYTVNTCFHPFGNSYGSFNFYQINGFYIIQSTQIEE